MKKKKLYQIGLISISTCFVLISFYLFITWYRENEETKNTERYLQQLSEDASVSNSSPQRILVHPPEDENDSYWNYTKTPFLQIDFTSLLEENKDTVGWIQVMGTDIDYAVVQTSDNTYYLNHSFDHTKNSSGWIFSDFRNNLEHLNSNTVIYGHGRLDGSMFGTLKNTLDVAWYENKENHIIKLSTPKENSIWQIVSVYTIPKESYYITTHFQEEEFQTFIDTIIDRSIYDFQTEVGTKHHILTLSTCQNNYGKRIVVHAKLIAKETQS